MRDRPIYSIVLELHLVSSSRRYRWLSLECVAMRRVPRGKRLGVCSCCW